MAQLTMTLTEFLLARIAEDAADARRSPRHLWDEIAFNDQAADDIPHIVRHSPTRVLSECEAKRNVIYLRAAFDEIARTSRDQEEARSARDTRAGMDAVLRVLALPYADHPDYREEWRP